MNVYDQAHALAKGLKESHEYQTLLQAKHGLGGDAQAQQMVKDFLKKRMEVAMASASGQEDKEKNEQLQRLGELLSANAKARDYLQAHMRFEMMMADVYKILGEAVAEGMDFLGQQG